MEKKLFILYQLLFCSIILLGILFIHNNIKIAPDTLKNDSLPDKISLGFIEITNNTDFIKFGFTGNGTIDNPYILDNQSLIDVGYLTSVLLSISDTDAYFSIRNCTMESSGTVISLSNVTHCTITNNTFNTAQSGIGVFSGSHLNFSYNTFRTTMDSIWVQGADNITINNNQVYDALEGFDLGMITNDDCSHNQFFNSGIRLSRSGFFTGINNTIFGKDIFYGYGLTSSDQNMLPIDPGQIILDNCQDIIVENYTISNANIGIQLISSDRITLFKNNISNNGINGIKVDTNSDYVDIINCTINNNIYGISVTWGKNVTVENCTIRYNQEGLFNHLGTHFLVQFNDISDNWNNGIYFMTDGHYSDFYNNTIARNNRGILFIESENITLTHNSISESTTYGLELRTNTLNTLILNNSFVNNNVPLAQATNSGTNNIFKNNYWNDWITPDDNSDGIVDNPYDFNGVNDIAPVVSYDRLGNISEIPITIYFVIIITMLISTITIKKKKEL